MTEYIYEVVKSAFTGTVIKRTDADGNEAWIPTDPANSDYQTYLASLEAPAIIEAEIIEEN